MLKGPCTGERRITKREFHTEGLSYGLLQTLSESFIDTRENQEKPLKTLYFSYNTLGQVTEERVEINNTTAYLKNISYDNQKNPLLITDSMGNKKETIISTDKKKIETLIQKTGEERETRTTEILDKMGRIKEEIDSQGTNIYSYDLRGNKIKTVSPFDEVTEYTYNRFNQITSITHPLHEKDEGVLTHPKETFTYDILGNVTQKEDVLGRITKTSYTTYGKPIEIIHPDGSKENFEYALDGSLKENTFKEGITHLYKRDFLKRPISIKTLSPTHTLLQETLLTYNPFRKLSEETLQGTISTKKITSLFYGYPKPLEVLK